MDVAPCNRQKRNSHPFLATDLGDKEDDNARVLYLHDSTYSNKIWEFVTSLDYKKYIRLLEPIIRISNL